MAQNMPKRKIKDSVFTNLFQDKKYLLRLIKKGKMSLDDIADCVPSLSFDELKKIEAEVMQLA